MGAKKNIVLRKYVPSSRYDENADRPAAEKAFTWNKIELPNLNITRTDPHINIFKALEKSNGFRVFKNPFFRNANINIWKPNKRSILMFANKKIIKDLWRLRYHFNRIISRSEEFLRQNVIKFCWLVTCVSKQKPKTNELSTIQFCKSARRHLSPSNRIIFSTKCQLFWHLQIR